MLGDHLRQEIEEERARDGGLVRGLVFALLLMAALILGGVAIMQASRAATISTEVNR